MTSISYQIGLLMSCQSELVAVRAATQQNWDSSIAVVNRNAEHFGGQGSEAFQDVMAVLNNKYQTSIDQLDRGAIALDSAIGNMGQTDLRSAGQYI
jgi:uncharacterized protein YukE